MQTIHISASGNYDVLIGSGLLAAAGEYAAKVIRGRCAALVSDDQVFALYGAAAEESLKNAGFRVVCFCFPHGEASKNAESYFRILHFLAENELTRDDCVVALGGGVTGDLAGFAAATYLRGIEYIQIPTTLLAMVDSSVGGKTAIDLPAGKNLVGAFWQPSLVLCDTDTLSTLSESVFSDGCAEIVKYAVLLGEPFFSELESGLLTKNLSSVLETCIKAKQQLVQKDEFDRGARQLLNLGHTFGHAIEAESGYRISHGCAVACGIAMICRAACTFALCDASVPARISALLRQFRLPTETSFSAERLSAIAARDKKRSSGTVTLIVPTALGACMRKEIPLSALPEWLRAGGAK